MLLDELQAGAVARYRRFLDQANVAIDIVRDAPSLGIAYVVAVAGKFPQREVQQGGVLTAEGKQFAHHTIFLYRLRGSGSNVHRV